MNLRTVIWQLSKFFCLKRLLLIYISLLITDTAEIFNKIIHIPILISICLIRLTNPLILPSNKDDLEDIRKPGI